MIVTGAYDLRFPALLEFRGPDAVRFLNGQLTQDVRKVAGAEITLPSCVTDAKGKLQFRVRLTEGPDGVLWVEGPENRAEELEARLTRYLIADDVETADLTGKFKLLHLLGPIQEIPPGIISRKSNRYGVMGTDWWIPRESDLALPLPAGMTLHFGDTGLESLRIANGVPTWGSELVEGMLPPEAALEETDISYQKGCYIGQEVISRIKSAGKVNKRLTRFILDAAAPVLPGPLENGAGELTSVSPTAADGIRYALGYVKRGATELSVRATDGTLQPLRIS
jgi:tRNA-modifying protein YgfZ